MTRMTMLHFASPFAFSMPAPSQSSASAARGLIITRDDMRDTTASRADLTDTLSTLLKADPDPSQAENAASATAGEGFEASAYDTVLRRYLEQQDSRSVTGAASPTDPEDEEGTPG